MIGWILDMVPVWVWLVAAGVALALTYQLWLPIWLALPRSVKVVLGGAVALAGAYLAGRNRGASGERERQKKASEQAARRRQEIDDEIANAGHADVDRRLNDWMRD